MDIDVSAETSEVLTTSRRRLADGKEYAQLT